MNTLKRNPIQLVLVALAVLAVTAGAWGTLLAAGPGDKAPQVSSPTPTAHPDDAPVGDDWPRHPLPTATPAPLPPNLVISHTAEAQDRAKPRFRGELGGFTVVPIPGRNGPLEGCPGGRATFANAGDPELERSELFFILPGYKLAGAVLCDGRVLRVMAGGPQGMALRGYYTVPQLHIASDAPRDRIQLVTVAGRPGIQQLPVPGHVVQNSHLMVIQRPPGPPPQSGIVVEVTTDHQGAEYVQRIAEQIMAQGPR